MQWSDSVLQRVEDEEVEKTRATFHRNYSHMAQWVEQLTCIQEVTDSNPASEQIFFRKLALIALLLGIPSMHQNGIWVKLNARHLGMRICWLQIDSCFHLFITAHFIITYSTCRMWRLLFQTNWFNKWCSTRKCTGATAVFSIHNWHLWQLIIIVPFICRRLHLVYGHLIQLKMLEFFRKTWASLPSRQRLGACSLT